MSNIVGKVLDWFSNEQNIQWLKDNSIYFILGFVGLILLIWLIWFFASKRRRRHFRFHVHHFIYKIGLRKTMSRHWIGRVHVHECFDPLVDFLPHKHIIFNEETLEQPILIRKRVLFKLYKIADKLPNGVNLLIFQTYRSRSLMNEKWMKAIDEITAENPGMGIHEAMKLAKFKAEDPKDSIGGHVTGGAVDLALCNDNGEMFDYGTKFHEYSNLTFTKSKSITSAQLKKRKELVRLMERQGFINFPAEWWHFSYGDRTWAAYKGKRNGGIYGSAEIETGGSYAYTIPVNRSKHETHK